MSTLHPTPHEPLDDVAPNVFTAVGPTGAMQFTQLACRWCKRWYPAPRDGDTATTCPAHAQAAAAAAAAELEPPTRPLSPVELGAEIERLGRAVEVERTMRGRDAIAELCRLDPSLTPHGAELQLRAWRSARSRYTAAEERDARALAAKPGPTLAEVRARAPFVIAARAADRAS